VRTGAPERFALQHQLRRAPLRLNRLPRFVRFALVGCVGFCVDVAALYVSMHLLKTGPYSGRVVSYLSAVTCTWFLNRNLTFVESRSDQLAAEWLRFTVLNLSGGVVNYAVYALCVRLLGQAALPVLGVALGSLAGLCVNYVASRRFVFNGSVKCA
jgi:putative flippase GtrA